MQSSTLLARLLNAPFNRFVFFGAVNTALTYVIYLGCLTFIPYQASYTVSYGTGIFTSYCLNSRFVFCKPIVIKKALQYPVVYVTQFLIGIALLTVLVDTLRFDERLASPIVILLSVPVTFALSRFVITRRSDQ